MKLWDGGLVPGSRSLPPLAPTNGWIPGLVGIPDLNYCQVYNYLMASKAITSDGAEMGAMKSLKAVKSFKEGYVQDLKVNIHQQYAYVQSQTQASMKRILYTVEICNEKTTADVLAQGATVQQVNGLVLHAATLLLKTMFHIKTSSHALPDYSNGINQHFVQICQPQSAKQPSRVLQASLMKGGLQNR